MGFESGVEGHCWSVLLWIPSKSQHEKHYLGIILRDLFLQPAHFTGGKTKALSWWPCQDQNTSLLISGLHWFPCRFAHKQQNPKPATDKESHVFSWYAVELRKMCIAKYRGGKGWWGAGQEETPVAKMWKEADGKTVIWAQGLVFEVGIIMPAGLPS